jgi:hypothetical protein
VKEARNIKRGAIVFETEMYVWMCMWKDRKRQGEKFESKEKENVKDKLRKHTLLLFSIFLPLFSNTFSFFLSSSLYPHHSESVSPFASPSLAKHTHPLFTSIRMSTPNCDRSRMIRVYSEDGNAANNLRPECPE